MFNDAIIFVAVISVYYLGVRTIVAIKAKAFNEGYKRGRASNAYVREIVK